MVNSRFARSSGNFEPHCDTSVTEFRQQTRRIGHFQRLLSEAIADGIGQSLDKGSLTILEVLFTTQVFLTPRHECFTENSALEVSFPELGSNEESFGIFYGDDRLRVKLRFSGEAARRAERVQFHPSQRNRRGRGKTLIVELHCRGHRELIHELCHPDWMGQVKIEEPQELRAENKAYPSSLAEAL